MIDVSNLFTITPFLLYLIVNFISFLGTIPDGSLTFTPLSLYTWFFKIFTVLSPINVITGLTLSIITFLMIVVLLPNISIASHINCCL